MTLSTLVRPILSNGNVKRLASHSLRSSISCCHHHTAAVTSSCRQQLMQNHYAISHHRHQSTSSTDDDGPNNNSSSSDQTTTTIPNFPWRHSPTPPTRLLEADDYSGMPNNWRARYVRRLIAAKELNLSFWHVIPLPQLFGQQHEWEEELANNFSVAFGLAMKELMETLFDGEHHVTYNENEQSLKLEVTLDSNRDTTISSSSSTEDSSGNSTTEDLSAENSNDEMSLEDNAYLNSMMDQLLLQQYQHLLDYKQQHHQHPISIHLSLKPIKAQLENIFAVPMLTREIVASKPHLKGGYQRLEAVFKETKSYNEVKQKTYELAEQVGLESAKRTVTAEATITCLESFQVKDLESGKVLQGMEDGVDEEEVVHLVRFEMVTDRGEDNGKREGGNWKLIDVDDLLEGNVFH